MGLRERIALKYGHAITYDGLKYLGFPDAFTLSEANIADIEWV